MSIDMRKKLLRGALPLAAIATFSFIVFTRTPAPDLQGTTRKIVVFAAQTTDQSVHDAIIKRAGGKKIKSLGLINGAALYGNEAAFNALERNGQVQYLEDDVEVAVLVMPEEGSFVSPTPGKPIAPPPQPPQSIPWGIDRIDAELVWSVNTGLPVRVGIVDTGIDLNHPDLKLNIKGRVNTINARTDADDDHGHGTHVAGTVGALDNSIGLVGAAPGVHLFAIKALNASGSGFISDVVEGFDWAIRHHLQVINMSFGTTRDIRSLRAGIAKVHEAGIVQVAAAGNTGGAVTFPAGYPEVIAVSATDENNLIVPFSSRGEAVDLAAPGVRIPSTFRNGIYRLLSGTSMSAPHVTGAAALVLRTKVDLFDANGNHQWDPPEVQAKLAATATDLGDPGKDPLYGAGLVNANRAGQD